MRPCLSLLLICGLGLSAASGEEEAGENVTVPQPEPGTEAAANAAKLAESGEAASEEQAAVSDGYLLGFFLAENQQLDAIADSVDVDRDAFIDGLTAYLKGRDMGVSREYLDERLQVLGERRQQKMEAEAAKHKAALDARMPAMMAAAETLKDGAFSEAEGVEVTESGLGYEVLEAAEGASPEATDRVTVHYTGMLPDGSIFDSSEQRGQPATFGLNQVISGWTEGLQLMQVGSRYRFYIPSQLGYGEAGSPPRIPADTPLLFEVELLAVE